MVPITYNVRSLAVRKTTTVATALGIGLVVFVLATAQMLVAGVKKTLALSGRPDVGLVMRKGSDNEISSVLDASDVSRILGAPSAAHDDKGKPIGAGETVVVALMEKIGAPGFTNVLIRGVTDAATTLRPEVKIVDGRMLKQGSDEVVIGKRLRGRFKGIDLGSSFELRKNRPVKVVGVFEAGGSSIESEVWADLDTLRSAFSREGSVSSVRVKLESAGAFDAFKASMEGDKRYGFQAQRELDFFEKQSEGTSIFITGMGVMIAFFFAIAAMIGAMITMYAAVSNREREIGTLRALGFSSGTVLVSFLLEAVLLSLIGGAAGALASLAMGFVKFSMINFASWSEIVFSFEPTPRIIGMSLLGAAAMGVLGGFFPALRAARVSPVAAMRA